MIWLHTAQYGVIIQVSGSQNDLKHVIYTVF